VWSATKDLGWKHFFLLLFLWHYSGSLSKCPSHVTLDGRIIVIDRNGLCCFNYKCSYICWVYVSSSDLRNNYTFIEFYCRKCSLQNVFSKSGDFEGRNVLAQVGTHKMILEQPCQSWRLSLLSKFWPMTKWRRGGGCIALVTVSKVVTSWRPVRGNERFQNRELCPI
jgi:hypothetical protein